MTNIHAPQNKDNNKEENEELSHGYFKIIDNPVWEDDELSAWEILLYGLINALSKQKGYAYASTRALVKMMPQKAFKNTAKEADKERMVRKWLSTLQEREHIFIESEKRGFVWKRRIYTALTVRSKKSYEGTSTSYRKDLQILSDRTSTSYLEEHNSNNIKKKREGGTPIGSPLPLSYGEFNKIVLHVEDYHDLTLKFGKELLEQIITEADEWLASSGQTKKNHKAFLQSWARREKKFDTNIKKEDLHEKNKAYATQTIETLRKNGLPKEVKLYANSSYIELGTSSHPIRKTILFSEKGFKDKLDSELKKRGLIQCLDKQK